MKKVNLIFASAAFALSVGLSGCAKEDPAKPLEINLNKTATIKGTVLYVENHSVTEPTYKAAPISGSDIKIKIPYSDLNSLYMGYDYYIVESKNISCSNGEFTATIPATDSGVEFEIEFGDFEGKYNTGSKELNVLWMCNSTASGTVSTNETINVGPTEYNLYVILVKPGDKL